MKPKISLVTLAVADFAKSFAFYRGLGFEAHNHGEDESYAMFEMEGTWLSIFPRDLLAEDAEVSPEGSGFRGFTLAHNVASEVEVDGLHAFALSLGAKPIKPPRATAWGGYSGYFADPDGFLWEIAFNPFTDLT